MIDISLAIGGGEQGCRNFKILLLYKFTSSNVMKRPKKQEQSLRHWKERIIIIIMYSINYYGRNTYIHIAQITIS